MDPEAIIAENFTFAPRPDVTFLLEIPVEEGLARIKNGRAHGFSAFEVKEELEKVARVYQAIEDPSMIRLSGMGLAELIHEEIMSALRSLGLSLPCPAGGGLS